MKGTRALWLLLACTGWAGAAHAVALGEINVTSRLNQSIVATIPVATTKPGELEGATVELASNDEFERAGLDRGEFLSALRFEIKDGYIKVTSKQIAREPFVSFLLDVRWIGGRILREYTVLLDPPTTSASAAPRAKTVQTPQPPAETPDETSAGAAPADSQMGSAQPAPEEAPAVSAPPSAPAPIASSSGTYGPTQPQETLWSIAYKLRPDLSLTMDQMQVAIFNANPHAFDHGRINGLMKNQTLRVPTADEIRAVDPVAAKAQVASARSGGSPVPAPRPSKPKPEPKAEAAPVAPTPAPEVAAAPPPPPKEEPKPEPVPEPKAEPATPPPASVPPPASTLAQASPPPTEAAPTPAPAPAEPAPAPVAEAKPAEAATPAPAPAPKVQAGSVAGDVMDRVKELVGQPWFFPAAAGFVLLLAGIFGFNKIRDKYAKWAYERAASKAAAPKAAPTADTGDGDATQVAADPAMDLGASAHDAVTQMAPPPVAATQVLAAQTLQQTMQSTGSQPLQQTVQQTQMLEPALAQTGGQKVDFDVTGNFANETVQINLDAGDPVSEAEFHRAYGLYDEAALLLKQALQKDPKRTDARVKLAEIYFEASKAAEFVETAKELKGQLSPEEWQKIALLGTQIAPGNEMFAAGASSTTGTVDLSFDDPEPAAPTAAPAPAPAPAAPATDAGLDFKFDEVQLDTPAAAAPAPAAPAEGGLEFDLGSLSLDTPAAPAAAPAEAAPAAAPADGELNLADFDLGTEAPTTTPADGGESLDLSSDLSVDPNSGGDESSTKLDLARAYIDMGDSDMAKSLLNEVVQQGNAQQKNEAQELLKRVPG